MLQDEHKLQHDISELNTQIRSLSYLIRMDRIDPRDLSHHLVSKKAELEATLERLLIRVRLEKEIDRRINQDDDKTKPQPFS
jgi:hypothetical protein